MTRFLRTLVWLMVAVDGILALWMYSERGPVQPEVQRIVLLQPVREDASLAGRVETLTLQAEAGRYYLRIVERHRVAHRIATVVLLANLFFLAVVGFHIKEEKLAGSSGKKGGSAVLREPTAR